MKLFAKFYKIMIYSFLTLPFWPGSGSDQGKNMRIRADPDPDPKPWYKKSFFFFVRLGESAYDLILEFK